MGFLLWELQNNEKVVGWVFMMLMMLGDFVVVILRLYECFKDFGEVDVCVGIV